MIPNFKPQLIKRRSGPPPVKPAPGSKPPQTSSTRPTTAAPPSNRFKLTASTKPRTASPAARTESTRYLSPPRPRVQNRKRKVSPSAAIVWDTDSDEDSDASDDSNARKRAKTSSSMEPPSLQRGLKPDYKRRIRYHRKSSEPTPDAKNDVDRPIEPARLIDSIKLTREKWASHYKSPFPGLEKNLVVNLQYPSPGRPETFEIISPPPGSDDVNPLDDIYYTIEEIIQNYLPAQLVEDLKLSDEADGIVRRLKRAVFKNQPDEFQSALSKFNTIIKDNLDSISDEIDNMHALPLSLVNRITIQVYQRTVSYRSHLLRRVKGKETTYGELKPRFAHKIFEQTNLNSQCVFVDLGSGVGNMVLQAALQTGAESFGIEIMEKPADYALDQASELRARAKLWNISIGPIKLLHGDFLNSPETTAVLQRADVVLVNNKVFPQNINFDLLNKFLDLKPGAKIVSLESFGAGAGKQGSRNENNIFNIYEEEVFESGSNMVSWTDASVEYFIATKGC
ncbi:DOT1-domain-containing protein [Periconia macrospinosa]|uniref:Histone-lysine N-methyltransferase, H3 lysine-79 specific n=1 Tax=Periconia macrospinosa TaxID=97972 RepID=A0A2V1DX86_9PLEO|nr:DOT1-domain-containing protein [Periconia macrospinosa]